jgi:hypothetical protein
MAVGITLLMFALTVAGQAALTRTTLPGSNVARYACLSLLSGIVLMVVLATFVQATLFAIAVCAALFGFLCELYLFLFTMISSSVSASLLRTLRRQGSLSIEEVERFYDSKGMVVKRLERMRRVGLLDPTGEKVTARGRALVSVFGFLRRAFGHDKWQNNRQTRRAA